MQKKRKTNLFVLLHIRSQSLHCSILIANNIGPNSDHVINLCRRVRSERSLLPPCMHVVQRGKQLPWVTTPSPVQVSGGVGRDSTSFPPPQLSWCRRRSNLCQEQNGLLFLHHLTLWQEWTRDHVVTLSHNMVPGHLLELRDSVLPLLRSCDKTTIQLCVIFSLLCCQERG